MDAVMIASVVSVVAITAVMIGGFVKLISLIKNTHSEDHEATH